MAISRALLGEPKMVILDEPTAALGVAQTQQVLDLVLRLKERGLGVLLVSHNLADVFQVADRVVVLRLGRNAGEFEADVSNHSGGRRRHHRRRGGDGMSATMPEQAAVAGAGASPRCTRGRCCAGWPRARPARCAC